MTGGSLGQRTPSYGSLQLHNINGTGVGGFLQAKSALTRKTASKMQLPGSREKDKSHPFVWCLYIGRRKVSMLLLFALALLVFVLGSFVVNKESTGPNVRQAIGDMFPVRNDIRSGPVVSRHNRKGGSPSTGNGGGESDENKAKHPPPSPTMQQHPCATFRFPPPPPPALRRIGPRPCPVCYLPVEQAIASMPKYPSESPVLHNLTYFHDERPVKSEPHGGSDFGGYPSLKQRNDSFNIKKSMTVHCGFVKGSKPGHQTGFDIDEADLAELEQFHDVIVASAIFGNYDLIQQPINISEATRKNVPFYMFVDEQTEEYMRNSSILDSNMRVGLWRIIVVHNVPYSDARRNGKIPKLLLHRILPNVRYSIWIDGKLQLVVDPYQILERFLWRQNANFAISRHYRRFDVFVEAEANKAAGKYDNASIDFQIEFYKKEGLTPYSETKLPITSDVPEGCVIIREHIPVTNLFTCMWFNEVDRFTSRDQLSFSTVRDKIMAKVDWSINMFLDCERRNFVIQAYHRDVLEHLPPPSPALHRHPSPLSRNSVAAKNPGKKISSRRKSGSRRHRKAAASNKDNNLLQ